jgi:hypothetical protein
MIANDHFTVTISSLNGGLNDDRVQRERPAYFRARRVGRR